MGRFDALTTLDKKPPTLTPLLEKKTIEQAVSKPENLQTGLPVNLQTSKDARMQTRKPANLQARKQVNLQTGKQVEIEKYSSYLTHEYKKALKRIALETDRNEYEVLIEAVGQYLAGQKQRQ